MMQRKNSSTPFEHYMEKQMLSSGISENVYKKNMHRFFTVSLPVDDDIDEISFISILDRSCSVSLINLSNEDIKAEKSAIKSTSSDLI